MPQVPVDEDREQRITYEIIVDCYDEYEVAAGWYCHLEDRLDFPFEAEWLPAKQSTADLVEVIAMADSEDCEQDMFVQIRYPDDDDSDILTVPLTEIEPLGDHPEREQAIDDWKYWLAQGGGLIEPYEDEEY
jgi:hypothetical protein